MHPLARVHTLFDVNLQGSQGHGFRAAGLKDSDIPLLTENAGSLTDEAHGCSARTDFLDMKTLSYVQAVV